MRLNITYLSVCIKRRVRAVTVFVSVPEEHIVTHLFCVHASCLQSSSCSMDHVEADRMKLTVNGLVLTDESRVCMACCLILSG